MQTKMVFLRWLVQCCTHTAGCRIEVPTIFLVSFHNIWRLSLLEAPTFTLQNLLKHHYKLTFITVIYLTGGFQIFANQPRNKHPLGKNLWRQVPQCQMNSLYRYFQGEGSSRHLLQILSIVKFIAKFGWHLYSRNCSSAAQCTCIQLEIVE